MLGGGTFIMKTDKEVARALLERYISEASKFSGFNPADSDRLAELKSRQPEVRIVTEASAQKRKALRSEDGFGGGEVQGRSSRAWQRP